MQTTEQISHPTRDELELSAVLHALSDPVRLMIVAELARGGREYTCGAFALPVTKSTCTHHFKVLREAGVIQQRHKGTTRLNTLRRADLEARFPGLLGAILKAAGDTVLEPGGEIAVDSGPKRTLAAAADPARSAAADGDAPAAAVGLDTAR